MYMCVYIYICIYTEVVISCENGKFGFGSVAVRCEAVCSWLISLGGSTMMSVSVRVRVRGTYAKYAKPQ